MKRNQRLIILALVMILAVIPIGPVMAEDTTSIYSTDAFQDFINNGLPSFILTPGEEKTIEYEDGSKIVMGVIQNNKNSITRDPVMDAETIVYSNFYNSTSGINEFSIYVTANYRYGYYHLFIDENDISHRVQPGHNEVTIMHDLSETSLTEPSSAMAIITVDVDVKYSDTAYNQTFRVADQTMIITIESVGYDIVVSGAQIAQRI
jgi:hypothetical protein